MRTTYRTRMKFFRDSDELTTVEWFFTDKPPLPFPTVFGSRNWDAEGYQPPLLGEVEPWNREYVNSSIPVTVPPADPYGDPSLFLTGAALPPDPPVLLADDGFPVDAPRHGVPFDYGFDFGFES